MMLVRYFYEDCIGRRYKNPHLHRLLPQHPSLFETHSYNPCEQSSWRRTLVGSSYTFTSPVLTTTLLYVDYILMLNNYLQSTGEAHLLSWEFSHTGPGHQATHTAVAKSAFLSSRRAEGHYANGP